ncbi:MAG: GNAT family N-acetyltransferase [Longimicrobiales bacterium]
MTDGYLHAGYAAALAEWGTPWPLQHAGGWALVRAIPDTTMYDAMGCYPLLACTQWRGLADDLNEAARSLVAFAAVIDPLANVPEAGLRAAFPDVLRHFKDHFIVDLHRHEPVGSAEHRRKARRAASRVDVEVGASAEALLPAWNELYAELTRRHAIQGIREFSPSSFAAQLRVPGLTAIRALVGGATAGMTLWAEHGGNVYYHLGAQNQQGYAVASSYVMFDVAIRHFRERGCRLLSLGAGAGVTHDVSDGLSRFKRGWATGTMPALFGGRILRADDYAALGSTRAATAYFPIYRAGEFG